MLDLREARVPLADSIDRLSHVEAGAVEPEPHLLLAECLRESARADETRRVVEEALRGPLSGSRRLWHFWLRIVFEEMGTTAKR